MTRNHCLTATLTLTFFALASVNLRGQDDSDQQRSAEHSRIEAPKLTWMEEKPWSITRCEVYYICVDEEETVIDSGYGEGSDADPAVALSKAVASCGAQSCDPELTKICCEATPAQHPCVDVPFCEEEEGFVYPYKIGDRDGYLVVPANRKRFEYSAIGLDTGQAFSVARTDQTTAWNVFLRTATSHGGFVQGSLRSRVVPAHFYRCYLRLRSRDDDTIYLQQVEGIGSTGTEALEAAHEAASNLYTHLIGTGHTDVEVLPGNRLDTVINSLANVCRTSVQGRHQCQTVDDDLTLVVSRFASTRDRALGEAAAIAEAYADQQGGVVPGSCLDLPALLTTNSMIAAESCEGCSEKAKQSSDASVESDSND